MTIGASMAEALTVRCSSCGAPLPLNPTLASVWCPTCRRWNAVPDAVRAQAARAPLQHPPVPESMDRGDGVPRPAGDDHDHYVRHGPSRHDFAILLARPRQRAPESLRSASAQRIRSLGLEPLVDYAGVAAQGSGLQPRDFDVARLSALAEALYELAELR